MANTTLTANSRRLLLALILAAAASWLHSSPTSAHAAYESSSPAFAEQLSESPTKITIRFTQELFRREGANTMELARTTSSDLLDVYEIGPVQISNDDRKVMTAHINVELPPGRYAVLWSNLSAEDGDEDSGWLIFYVSADPEPWQIQEDRKIAQELLIAYPGDTEEDPSAADAPATATPTVVRTAEADSEISLGVGPIIWLALGALAAMVVVAALGYRLGRRGRAG